MALDTSYVLFDVTSYVPTVVGTSSVFYQSAKLNSRGDVTGYVPVKVGTSTVFYQAAKTGNTGAILPRIGESTLNNTFKVSIPNIYTNSLTGLQGSVLPSQTIIFGSGVLTYSTGASDNETNIVNDIKNAFQSGVVLNSIGGCIISPSSPFLPILVSLRPDTITYTGSKPAIAGSVNIQTKVIALPIIDSYHTSYVSSKVGSSTIPDAFKSSTPIYTNTLTGLQGSILPSSVVSLGTGVVLYNIGSSDVQIKVIALPIIDSYHTSYVSSKVGSSTIPDAFKFSTPIYTNTLTGLQGSILPSSVVSLGTSVTTGSVGNSDKSAFNTVITTFGTSTSITAFSGSAIPLITPFLPVMASLRPDTITYTGSKPAIAGSVNIQTKVIALPIIDSYHTSYVSSKVGSSTIPDAFKSSTPIYTNTLTGLQGSILPSSDISLGTGVVLYNIGSSDNLSKITSTLVIDSFQTSIILNSIGTSQMSGGFTSPNLYLQLNNTIVSPGILSFSGVGWKTGGSNNTLIQYWS